MKSRFRVKYAKRQHGKDILKTIIGAKRLRKFLGWLQKKHYVMRQVLEVIDKRILSFSRNGRRPSTTRRRTRHLPTYRGHPASVHI